MRPIRFALRLITVLALLLVASVACKQGAGQVSAMETNSNHGRENESEAGLSAILFVNELSCPCTREQCRVAEGIVQTLKENFSNRVRFDKIDYELENEKAKPLLQKYEAIMIPVLVLLEGDRVLWKCEDFSDENAVRSRFKEIVLKGDDEK
ncbi:MAG: hypothetical protein C4532_00065 [Candidatus Abyssobacteria bacterium SURF_17]|uniref:Thioredoxin domain-containing protein n=1 Tax=Candidatus Abyssobacteria bacterium SURF_17 TaxID=2093361 RepID=A0A419F9T7_9BACT|nr:MAG: hypothetical protein C4532_00065 [Candidatus Abyssubacteria bacterium SURF_17]